MNETRVSSVLPLWS